MTRVALALIAAGVLVALTAAAPAAQDAAPAWTADLGAVRAAAALVPGRKPLRLNVLKFAESRRTKNFSVKGAAAEPSIQARTAFQVVYADATVMVDAGMEQRVHAFFGRGVVEPYDAAAAARVEQAVRRARLVVVTHEHGDHVAGVVTPPDAVDLARKTVLTRTQVATLVASPQMPEIRLTEETARRYIVVDYDRVYPLAPGMVLLKAGGHTPGSQMVYVVLESGREYLLIGDATWHMDGVRQMVGKAAPWVIEDEPAVLAQLRWLNAIGRGDPSLVVVASHDEEQRTELVARGLLGGTLE